MGKKILGILVVGLVFSLILPVTSAYPAKPLSPLKITIRGGLGIHVFIKNTGTTDVHVSDMKLNLDGARIVWNTGSNDLDIKAGTTKHVIYVVLGLGATNIEVILDTITQTASGKVLVWFVYGVE